MRKLKVGAVGPGRAFAFMLPTSGAIRAWDWWRPPDPRPEALEKFERDFQGKGFLSVGDLCRQPGLDVVVYVPTPHQFHAEHAQLAMNLGKHVLVEKPMALSLEECRTMVVAARLAILRSARERREIPLTNQIALRT